jgi:hypothetical protein
MKRLISIGLGALFVAIATHGSLFAQASSYGSSGGGGGGSFGSSTSAFSSASNAFGSSGAFGSSSTSSGASGNTANGANGGLVGMSGGGMYGGTGYGPQNGAGRGGSNYSSSSQYGNRSSGQNGQFGGGQGRQGGGSRRGGTGQNQGQSGQGGGGTAAKDQQPWYEPRIEVGFSVPTPAPTVVQTNITAPLHTAALTSRFGSVNVSVQGSTVTLKGTVTSEEDRQLAAQMAMLEPTVSSVQNDLKVAAPAMPAAMPPR